MHNKINILGIYDSDFFNFYLFKIYNKVHEIGNQNFENRRIVQLIPFC